MQHTYTYAYAFLFVFLVLLILLTDFVIFSYDSCYTHVST